MSDEDFELLDPDDDVINFSQRQKRNSSPHPAFMQEKYTLLPSEFLALLQQTIKPDESEASNLFEYGMLCRVRKSDAEGWQKGRVKIALMFVESDDGDIEPESVQNE